MPKSIPDLSTFLGGLELSRGLDNAELEMLAHLVHCKQLARGETLFQQHAPGDAAHIVRTGRISIVLDTEEGRELVINQMCPGDCFGELALVTGGPRSASAVAGEESRVLVLSRADFFDWLEKEPRFARHLLELIAQRLSASSERESALAFLDAPARLARALLDLAREQHAKDVVRASQEDLARRVGVKQQVTANGNTATTYYVGNYYEVQVGPGGGGVPTSTPSPTPTATSTLTAVGAGTYENNNPNVVYTGTWTRYTNSSASGGNYERSNVTGATASLKFNGAQITWVSINHPSYGIADVLLDGVQVDSVDLYAATIGYNKRYSYPTAPGGPHTVTIRVSGTKNPLSGGKYIVVDAFIVSDQLTPTPTPSSTATRTSTPTLTATPSRTATATPTLSEWTRYGAQDTQITYSTSTNQGTPVADWNYNSSWSAMVSYINATDVPSATLKFVGSQVIWHAHQGPTFGLTRVTIDNGAPSSLCNYGTDGEADYTFTPGYGIHTILLEALQTTPCNGHSGKTGVVAFDVYDPRQTPTPMPGTRPYLNLSHNPSQSNYPSIAASRDGQTLAAVWVDRAEGNADIYLSESLDGGGTWSAPLNLSRSPGSSADPAVALDLNGTAHIVWSDSTYRFGTILYCRYTGGSSCDKLYTLSEGGEAGTPKLVASGSTATTLHLVWVSDVTGHHQVYYRASDDGGEHWTSTVNVSNSGSDAGNPAVAAEDSGKVHVVWADIGTPGSLNPTPTPGATPTAVPSGTYKLYYRKYNPGTGLWSAYEVVESSAQNQYVPAVGVDSGGNVHVAYQMNMYGPDVWYRQRTRSGTWDASATNLSGNSGDSYSPSVAIDGSDNVQVVWQLVCTHVAFRHA